METAAAKEISEGWIYGVEWGSGGADSLTWQDAMLTRSLKASLPDVGDAWALVNVEDEAPLLMALAEGELFVGRLVFAEEELELAVEYYPSDEWRLAGWADSHREGRGFTRSQAELSGWVGHWPAAATSTSSTRRAP